MEEKKALERMKASLLEEIAPIEREVRVLDGAIAFLRTGPKIDWVMNAITKLQEQREPLVSKRFALSLQVIEINVKLGFRFV